MSEPAGRVENLLPLGLFLLSGILCVNSFAAGYYVSLNRPSISPGKLGSLENPYATIQTAVAKLAPGDTVFIRGGRYIHNNDKKRTFIAITTSGTAVAPITVQNFGNEQVTLVGRGFEDRDLNGDGRADGAGRPPNERLISIRAHYVHVNGLELTNSNRWGLYIRGDNNLVENCHTHDNGDVEIAANVW